MNAHFSPMRSRTQLKLEGFSQLEPGWHYGRGAPISRDIIDTALNLYNLLLLKGLTRTDAFAGADGEVLLTAYRGDHYVGITIEPDGSFGVVHEVEGSDDDEMHDGLTLGEVKECLGGIADIIWRTSASFIRTTSTPTAESSGISLSSDHRTVGCPYSTSDAPKLLVAA